MDLSDIQRLNMKNLAYDTMNLARHDEGMEVYETEELVAVNSQLPSYNFNIITPISLDVEQMGDQLAAKIERFNRQKLPVNIWCLEEDHKMRSFLQEMGLTEYHTSYEAMALRLRQGRQEERPQHPSFQVKRVTSPTELGGYIRVLQTVYEEAEEKQAIESYYKGMQEILLKEEQSTRLYIGLSQGRVVTTGALTLKEQSIGMYHIATDPARRGQGFATKMVEALLWEAEETEALYCTLQASPVARKIYEVFGFQGIGKLRVFENVDLL